MPSLAVDIVGRAHVTWIEEKGADRAGEPWVEAGGKQLCIGISEAA